MDSHSAFQGNGVPFGCSTNHAHAKACETLLNSLQQSLLFQYVQHLPTLQEKEKRRQTYQKREAKKPFISISKMFQQWRQLYDRIGVKNSELAVCLLDR